MRILRAPAAAVALCMIGLVALRTMEPFFWPRSDANIIVSGPIHAKLSMSEESNSNDSQLDRFEYTFARTPFSENASKTLSNNSKHLPDESSNESAALIWSQMPNHVCMQNAQPSTTKEPIQSTISDNGGARSYKIDVKPPSGTVIWRPSLLLSWFTCEGNLHHFLTETLHPIVHALETNTKLVGRPPLVGIVASSTLRVWKSKDEQDNCHNPQFFPLLSAFEVEPVIFSFPCPECPPDSDTHSDRGYVYPDPTERWQLDQTYCFLTTHQAVPGSATASLIPKLLSWSGCKTDTHGRIRVAIVQRLKDRRILNVDTLLRVAQELKAIHASVLVLETMTLQDQIREMACGHVIVAGVHGAGLQWTTLMGQQGGLRAGLIEWGWKSWGSYYVGRLQGDSRGIFRNIDDANVFEPCPVSNFCFMICWSIAEQLTCLCRFHGRPAAAVPQT